ncbi:MAG: ribosome maturation factor RimP [Acidimicrobiaceae bacterium]|nr:ribosome maturation factor RimP [Acidimicrobiaceae bacterium]MYF43387.1 ribosome maturation factor RimP [Acidimicrobiaceae bacterium]MYJ36982.1 ribosome maturation factor RimP [Acidimicrobiaceae bacterium]
MSGNTMAIADRVRELVAPLAEAVSVDLYDVEHHGGVVRVLVDADGGIDLDVIARLSRSISRALDEHDLIPGRYTLEVSSPGLERPLRTPEHFRRAAGSTVKVKTLAGFDGPRRLTGTLEAVADDGVDLRSPEGEVCRIAYEQLASARTVFEWGSRPHQAQQSKRPEHREAKR